MDARQAVLESFKSGTRKEFLIDFCYPIKLVCSCSMCGKRVLSENVTRAWFEVGGQLRSVYYPSLKHQGKGVTICSQHSEDEIISFLQDRYADAVYLDKELNNGKISFTVDNYQKEDRKILDRILCLSNEREILFDFIISSNKRYGEPNLKLKQYLDFDFLSASRKYVKAMLEEKLFGKNQAETTLRELFEDMKEVFSKNIVPTTYKFYKDKIHEKLTEVMIYKLLHLNEIPTEGFFLRKILKYVAKSTGEQIFKETTERSTKDALIREFDELQSKLDDLKRKILDQKSEGSKCSQENA